MKLAALVTGLISSLPSALAQAMSEEDFGNYIDMNIKPYHKDRASFTKAVVLAARDPLKNLPFSNWVIVHTTHKIAYNGTEGEDWQHFHTEFDKKGAGTIGYEIYGSGSGLFTLIGDGGDINWFHSGNTRETDDERQILWT